MRTLMRPKILLITALMACSAVTFAQTSGTAPSTGVNQPTTPIGVTPQTAAEANQKAVPRSDTGTVVRTSPNAADATRNATGMNNNSTSNTSGTSSTSSTSGASGNSSASGAAGTSGMNSTTDATNASGTSGGMRGNGTVTAMRKARADRN